MVFGNTDGGTASIPRTFRDGTSNTIVFAERYQMCNGTPCAWGYSSLYTWAPMFAYYTKGKFLGGPKKRRRSGAKSGAAPSEHRTRHEQKTLDSPRVRSDFPAFCEVTEYPRQESNL